MRKFTARRVIAGIAATLTLAVSGAALSGIGHQSATPGDQPQVTSGSSVEVAGQGDWPFRRAL